uniref:Uncharacterized protein n=1 Tax=Zea mays TaxID=4577 RepID=A0A804NR97_MAIZE
MARIQLLNDNKSSYSSFDILLCRSRMFSERNIMLTWFQRKLHRSVYICILVYQDLFVGGFTVFRHLPLSNPFTASYFTLFSKKVTALREVF